MQVAANAFSASHYHPYYQLHSPGPHDHALKRQYLALLPPQQIIDICLQFDIHVSPYVKSLIWPPDINAAIAGLQKAPPKPSEEKTPEVSAKAAVAAMNSLKSHDETTLPSIQNSLEPQPPDKPESNTPTTDSAAPLPAPSSAPTPPSPQPAQGPTPSTAPVPETQPPSAAAPAPTTQPPYPYAYAHAQAAYPHTPYYPPHAGYSYSYGSYPAPMQGAYHPQPPAQTTVYPPQPTIFNNAMAMHQSQLENVGGDDLPSYEEMLVEALAACSDPEGCAPKDLFLWMAARYPLQSNFRPSASQALQKAYKRGRFEKGSNGKYRINAGYIGANAIRRTTRRPQTQNAQAAPGKSAPAVPPFTHAPLVHHQGHSSSTPAQQPASASYSYPYAGYSAFTAHPAAATTSTIPGAPASTQPTTDPKPAVGTSAATDPDTVAAYEAAQNILSAINFGDLYQLAPEERAEGSSKDAAAQQVTAHTSTADNGVENLLSHVQAMLANAKADGNNQSNPPHPPPPNVLGSGLATTTAQPQGATDPSADPRAELQAQLALLAAQLADLAKTEEVPAPPQPQVAFAAPVPPAPPTLAHHPPPPPATIPPAVLPPVVAAISTTTPIHAPPISVAPAPPAPEASPEIQGPERPVEGEDDDSDDDDMEEII
ncbi:hypothetical protein M413DRAFT_438682 [Hebeloma cylindrosporum]|uniref:Histone H1 n=1 Tax=Hebeloma cylindrosporum TaxID=76867 RepID=A0A0C2YIA6_HEBCY|nr:hypothetical protein M413DRAFT_438682 [Hebeloma cylindrosporum h7]